jgi:YHS domain-containing protein
MQVEIAHAPTSAADNGNRVYFCSEHCSGSFVADPERYIPSARLITGSERYGGRSTG